MSGDIEEFLRQAAQRREKAQQEQARQSQGGQRQGRQDQSRQDQYRQEASGGRASSGRSSHSSSQSSYQSMSSRPSESPSSLAQQPVEIIEARSVGSSEGLGTLDSSINDPYQTERKPYESESGKSRLVSAGVSSADIASHADRLGSELIDHRDDAEHLIEEHLGKSVPTRDFEKEKESAFVNGLVQMFKSPQSVAQAVIMKEILTRPDFDRF